MAKKNINIFFFTFISLHFRISKAEILPLLPKVQYHWSDCTSGGANGGETSICKKKKSVDAAELLKVNHLRVCVVLQIGYRDDEDQTKPAGVWEEGSGPPARTGSESCYRWRMKWRGAFSQNGPDLCLLMTFYSPHSSSLPESAVAIHNAGDCHRINPCPCTSLTIRPSAAIHLHVMSPLSYLENIWGRQYSPWWLLRFMY